MKLFRLTEDLRILMFTAKDYLFVDLTKSVRMLSLMWLL
jgi:hypothetical protein